MWLNALVQCAKGRFHGLVTKTRVKSTGPQKMSHFLRFPILLDFGPSSSNPSGLQSFWARIPIVQIFFQFVFLPWKICSGQLKSIKDRLSGFFMPPFFYITMDIIVTLVKEYRQPMWPPRSCPLLMIKKNALNFNTFLSGMRKNGSMSNSGTPSCRNGKKRKGNKMVRKLNHRIRAKII